MGYKYYYTLLQQMEKVPAVIDVDPINLASNVLHEQGGTCSSYYALVLGNAKKLCKIY